MSAANEQIEDMYVATTTIRSQERMFGEHLENRYVFEIHCFEEDSEMSVLRQLLFCKNTDQQIEEE